MSKLQVTFGQGADSGVVFVNAATGKAETLTYEQPLEQDKALSALKSEVNGRHNVTRAALTMLVQILARDRVAGYMGKGKLGETGGMPAEVKSALRDAETEHFKPLFPTVEKMDTFLAGLREGGPYAVAKGICLKYFYYMGKLPCAYNPDGTPDTQRLLSGNAMMKLMRNETPDTNPKTWGDRVAELHQAFKEACEKKQDTVTDGTIIAGLCARLDLFYKEAKEWQNMLNVAATEHAAIMAKVKENPAIALIGQQAMQAAAPAAGPTPGKGERVKGKGKQTEKAAAKG